MIREIIDSITGPSPDEHLSIQNASYDGETVEELLPPKSKGGVHMKYRPSRDWIRRVGEEHGPQELFGMEYSIGRCGTWKFVERIDDETVREQCGGCGEYRTIEQ